MEPQLVVNGRSRPLGEVGGHVTLLEWLRADGLTGTKEGCAEGECGACAVLVARPDTEGRSRWTAINACLVPAAGFAGQEVLTSEGFGTVAELHPVQREMVDRGGSQCGYCTPGFICSMVGEYYRPDRVPTGATTRVAEAEPGTDGPVAEQQHSDGHRDLNAPGAAPDHEHGPNGFDLHALSGNLCRCTGYRPIRDAAYALGTPDADDPLWTRLAEPAPADIATDIGSDQGRYVRPAGLDDALTLLADHPDARLVAGSTDWGVELNIRHARAKLSIAVDRLPELRVLDVAADRHRHRRRADPHRDRARAGRPGAAAGGVVPAVRLPADPQRRHPGRQSRYGVADRRQPARAARARRLARAGLAVRGARGRAQRLLHRLPADAPPTRRADRTDPDPHPTGPADRLPQDRQASLRRHLQRGRRVRDAPWPTGS